MKLYQGAALALVLSLAACGGGDEGATAGNGTSAPPVLEQVEAPNGDWTQVVEETPEGGFRMGNPNAPVKLVEYGSLGCSHCADFSEKGSAPLTNTYVKSGQVSWEFRPFLIYPTDIAATMLMRCQGPQAFFRSVEQFYSQQGELFAKVQQLSEADLQRIQSLPPEQQSAGLIRGRPPASMSELEPERSSWHLFQQNWVGYGQAAFKVHVERQCGHDPAGSTSTVW